MNIAVLGSNCKFSSDLAVQLNKLKQSSLVYRYDALADFKKDVPLYKSLLKNTECIKPREVDIDFENGVPVDNDSIKKPSSFGEYIGDVETMFLDQPKKEEDIKKFDMLRSVFDALDMKVDNNTSLYSRQCLLKKLKLCEKNTQMFTFNLLNIINVFSGILNKDMLDLLLTFEPLTVVVRVKNNNNFLPCTITAQHLKELTEKNPQLITLEVSSIDELFNNNFFISTFKLREKKKKVEAIVETTATVVNHRVGQIHHIVVNGGVDPEINAGVLQMMMQQVHHIAANGDVEVQMAA